MIVFIAILAAITLVVAYTLRGRFAKASVLAALVSCAIFLSFVYESNVCSEYFCGLSWVVNGTIASGVVGLIALGLALVPGPETYEESAPRPTRRPRKAPRKKSIET